jgi:prepilin-type N-terminal cleavage/methylation domain-containing protein
VRKIFKSIQDKKELNKDDGFTLIEIVVTVIIIAILAGIAFIAVANQQKAAIIATVKHDVDSNKSIMAPGSGKTLYSDPQTFLKNAARTDQNIAGYTVNPSQSQACTQSVRKFDDEIVVYRFLTTVGKQEPLYCPDLGEEVFLDEKGTPNNGGVKDEIIAPVPESTGTPNNSDDGKSSDPISPGNSLTTIKVNTTSNENYRVCYSVVVNTTSETGASWSVKIDKTVAPFYNDNFIEGLNDSRYHITNNGNNYLLYGSSQMEKASTTNSVNPNFCVKAPNNLPIIKEKVNSLVTSSSSPTGGAWNGTQNFTIVNSSQYYSGWSVEVDLTDLRKTVSGKPTDKPFVDTDIILTHVSGNIYKIESSISYRSIKKDTPYTFTVRLG